MAEFFGKIGEVFTGASSGDLIEALAVALGLALVASGGYALARGKGDRSPSMALCGVMVAVSVASMAIAAASVRSGPRPDPGGPAVVGSRGRVILDAADADGDGLLTPREALGLVARSDGGGKGYADQFDLDHAG